MSRPKGSTTIKTKPNEVVRLRDKGYHWEKVAGMLNMSRSSAIALYKKAKEKK